MKIIISSFGFKFGTPLDTDITFDARKLRNPFNDRDLRKLSGMDNAVWKFVTSDPRYPEWKHRAEFEASGIVKQAEDEGRHAVMIGIGCTGGRHRSVVATLELARFFHWNIYGLINQGVAPGSREVVVGHRDLIRGGKAQRELRNIKDILETIPNPV